MRKLLKKYGFVPDKLVTDDLRSYAAAAGHLGIANVMNAVDGTTIERKIRISQLDEGSARCKVSRAWDPRNDSSQCMQQHKIPSTSSAISTSARTHRAFRASALQTWREVVAAA